MKATTAPQGRDPKEHGYPMHMCEILNQLTAPCYLVRTSCNTPANVAKTKDAIRKAFRNQRNLPSVMTPCPPKPATIRFRSIVTPPLRFCPG